MMSPKRPADSLDPADVPAAKAAKLEEPPAAAAAVDKEEVWIKVRQGEWSIDVVRDNLVTCNDAASPWFASAIDDDARTLDLPPGTCTTRHTFMIFFGSLVNTVTGKTSPWSFSATQLIALLHVADYCRCITITDNMMYMLEKTPVGAFAPEQLLELGRRYKNDALLQQAADAFVAAPVDQATPDALRALWPVYRARLGGDYATSVKQAEQAKQAIRALLAKVIVPRQWCSGACLPGCSGSSPAHMRVAFTTNESPCSWSSCAATLESVALALGM